MRCAGCDGSCAGDSACVHAAYKCYVFVEPIVWPMAGIV